MWIEQSGLVLMLKCKKMLQVTVIQQISLYLGAHNFWKLKKMFIRNRKTLAKVYVFGNFKISLKFDSFGFVVEVLKKEGLIE